MGAKKGDSVTNGNNNNGGSIPCYSDMAQILISLVFVPVKDFSL
jgi:hypothetical protein